MIHDVIAIQLHCEVVWVYGDLAVDKAWARCSLSTDDGGQGSMKLVI